MASVVVGKHRPLAREGCNRPGPHRMVKPKRVAQHDRHTRAIGKLGDEEFCHGSDGASTFGGETQSARISRSRISLRHFPDSAVNH